MDGRRKLPAPEPLFRPSDLEENVGVNSGHPALGGERPERGQEHHLEITVRASAQPHEADLANADRFFREVPFADIDRGLARRGLPLQAEKVHSDVCEPADPGHVGWEMLAQMAIPTLGTRTIWECRFNRGEKP